MHLSKRTKEKEETHKKTDSNTESKLVVAKGEAGGEMGEIDQGD